jgi:3-hydroxyacyl-CoA dehydrogenase/enoyl-CoA hydratase/3-hydroxybutyryl-CoA epimerase
MEKRRRSGSLSRIERDRQWYGLLFTTEPGDVAGADLVIEAVFEDLPLKRKVLAETEAVLDPGAVYASNTSALPITEIAAEARHPERILGMHYFSPVPKMPLLELVTTRKTSLTAVATARAYGVAQGKTVIVVRDGPGFYTTRILAPFLNEAVLLVEEGASVEALDEALKAFGFPVGPATLLDEVGIDVGSHVSKDLGAAFESRGMQPTISFDRLVAAGLLGRKSGRGFYVYPKGKGRKTVNHDAYALLGARPRQAFDAREAADRLVLLMVNEALHCLSEGVIGGTRDGDVGAVLGLGFPPFFGGPFHYVDGLGASAVADRMKQLADSHGPRFTPAELLLQMAKGDRRFYPRAGERKSGEIRKSETA